MRIVRTLVDLKTAGLHIVKRRYKRGHKAVVIGLLYILGYHDVFLREERDEFFAVYMFFNTVKPSITGK